MGHENEVVQLTEDNMSPSLSFMSRKVYVLRWIRRNENKDCWLYLKLYIVSLRIYLRVVAAQTVNTPEAPAEEINLVYKF